MVLRVGSRYGADGSPNFAYYGVKLGGMVALGIAGARFLPGRMKGVAVRATEGALTVGAYEMMRLMLPANIALGYYSNAAISRGTPVSRNLGAYSGRRLAGLGTSSGSSASGSGLEARIGENTIR